MAGGPYATNRALNNCCSQALFDDCVVLECLCLLIAATDHVIARSLSY